jgi:signal transduction histidine kinase/response regulator of citrate/malate metabolism
MSDDAAIITDRILYEALKRAGFQMDIQIFGIETAIEEVKRGDFAVIPVQADTLIVQNDNLVKVNAAIDNAEISVYTLSNTELPDEVLYSKWSDLQGMRLGYREQNFLVRSNIRRANGCEMNGNYISEHLMCGVCEHSAHLYIEMSNLDSLWASLLAGDTDAVILSRMSHYEHRFPQGIVRSGIIEKLPKYTYVNKSFDEQYGLAALLEEAYTRMINDGTLDAIKASQPSSEVKSIIHINSYSAGSEKERIQTEQIRHLIENEYSVNYRSYYLNSDNSTNRASFNSILSKMIRTDFSETSPDLVIASGDEALEFVTNRYYTLFPNVPVLFCSVKEVNESLLYGLESHVTGFVETLSIYETLTEMLRLFPDTRQVFVLNDSSSLNSIRIREEIISIQNLRNLPVEFGFSENKQFEEILDDIERFASDTLVLIGSYTAHSESNVQHMVALRSVNPVFCLSVPYIGNGTLGGKLSSTDEYSRQVAESAIEILSGVSPSVMPITNDSSSFNRWHFDHAVAGRFGIDVKYLPANHVIINRDIPVWESNPAEFRLTLILILMLLIVFFVTIVLIRLMSRKRAIESASRAKSVFLANMSHEIRTPMNSIIGFSELAQYGEISPKTRHYLVNIHESAKWLLNIINDILDISKIESGKIELESIPFDLPDIFSHCQSLIVPKVEEKGITLYCYAEPSLGKKLLGDPVRLRQALINLLSNAVKFTNSGTVKLLASITKSAEGQATIHFEVKDSGIGMTPEQTQRIFKAFVQGDGSITRKFGGTGLGLAITKNIIDLMGGVLLVESTPGVGSRFSFDLTFPLVDDVAEIPTRDIILKSFEKPYFKGEVLICEDNSLNQQVICDHLARVGLSTVVAQDGKEGVDIVSKRLLDGDKPFDLILMDIHMPVMDGLEAASRIKEIGSKTPVVAVTANIMSNDVELYKESGMSDCLGKPFTSHELWKCLVKYIPVTGYSVSDGIATSEEDRLLQERFKNDFIKINRDMFTRISELIDSPSFENIKSAHRLAHSLKSNAGQIGEQRLRDIAGEVENALKDGKVMLNEFQLNNLNTELQSVLDKLSLLPASPQPDVKKINDHGKIREAVAKLEPLLVTKNPECEDFVDIMSAFYGTELLVSYLEKFKFKQATEELAILKKKWGI